MLKNKFLRTPVERSVSKSRALSKETNRRKELNMKNYSFKVLAVIAVGLLLALLVSTGLAQQPDSSATKQLNNTAKNTARFDGGPGSTINTSTGTTTRAPAVVRSSGTVTGASTSTTTSTSAQRQQRAIDNYKNSGAAVPRQIQEASSHSLHSAPPPPAPAPKPQPKQEPKKNQPTTSGTVPTGR